MQLPWKREVAGGADCLTTALTPAHCRNVRMTPATGAIGQWEGRRQRTVRPDRGSGGGRSAPWAESRSIALRKTAGGADGCRAPPAALISHHFRMVDTALVGTNWARWHGRLRHDVARPRVQNVVVFRVRRTSHPVVTHRHHDRQALRALQGRVVHDCLLASDIGSQRGGPLPPTAANNGPSLRRVRSARLERSCPEATAPDRRYR
jgi:hypothetical protein